MLTDNFHLVMEFTSAWAASGRASVEDFIGRNSQHKRIEIRRPERVFSSFVHGYSKLPVTVLNKYLNEVSTAYYEKLRLSFLVAKLDKT